MNPQMELLLSSERRIGIRQRVAIEGRNEVSNLMLTNIYTRRSDASFRFVVMGRTDSPPIPVNLRHWFKDRPEDISPRCGKERQQTLAHILNECTPN
jgi:hypothetical protein